MPETGPAGAEHEVRFRQEEEDLHVVDASPSVEDVAEEIWRVVRPRVEAVERGSSGALSGGWCKIEGVLLRYVVVEIMSWCTHHTGLSQTSRESARRDAADADADDARMSRSAANA